MNLFWLIFGIILSILFVAAFTIYFVQRYRKRRLQKSESIDNKIVDRNLSLEIGKKRENERVRTRLAKKVIKVKKRMHQHEFKKALNLLSFSQKFAKKHQVTIFNPEIEQLMQTCTINLTIQQSLVKYQSLFKSGKLGEAYLGVYDLVEKRATPTISKQIDPEILSQATQTLATYGEEFANDKTQTTKILSNMKTALNNEKFISTFDNLKNLDEICHNLKFTEYYNDITTLKTQTQRNIEFSEDLQKELNLYDKGNLRLSYNALDVLDRRVKLENNRDLIVKPLNRKIANAFEKVRKEIRTEKKRLNDSLWKVFKLINEQRFSEAVSLLDLIERDAKVYDFFEILRDVKDQREQVHKFQELSKK